MSKLRFNFNKTNRDLEKDGQWVPHNEVPEIMIKVRRLKSPRVQEAFIDMQMRIREEKNPEEVANLHREFIAKHVLVDWKGVYAADENDEVKEIPYTVKDGLAALHDADFMDFVYIAANDRSNFEYDDKGKIFEEAIQHAKKS